MRWLRSWGVVLGFVVVDLVVLALAWQRMHATPVADAAASTSASSPTATSSGASAGSQIRGPLFLAATDDGAVLRVTRGSCDARNAVSARVWVAPTTGAALTRSRVPGLQEALAVYASDNALRIVGTDSGCDVHGWISTDHGSSWKQGSVPSRVWYLDTDTTAAVVHGPVAGKVQNLDCTPVSVTTLDRGSRALVSCSGSNVLLVPDDATAATVSYAVTSPAAAAQPAGGQPLVLAATDTCAAELARIVSQQEAATVACLSQDDAPLGLAVDGQRVLAQVGQRLLLSTDLGKHFGTYPRP